MKRNKTKIAYTYLYTPRFRSSPQKNTAGKIVTMLIHGIGIL